MKDDVAHLPSLPLRFGFQLVGLGVVLFLVGAYSRVLAPHHRLLAIALLSLAAVAWIGWRVSLWWRRDRGTAIALALMAAAGGTLAGLLGISSPVIFLGVAGMGAALTFDLPLASGLAAVGLAALAVTSGSQVTGSE